MLATQTLRKQLLALGFTPLEGARYGNKGTVQVCLLDGPRLVLDSPQAGLRYVAILSAQHLAQEVAAFQAASPPLPQAI